MGGRDFTAGAADLDPQVTFVVKPPFAEPGVYQGRDGVRDYMRDGRAVGALHD